MHNKQHNTMTQQEFTQRYTYDAATDLLGDGGFGRVYRAYDNYEHEYVALKIQTVDPKHPELRLKGEVSKVQQYTHRYIAKYKDCYTFSTINGEIDVAVMKYYKDGSLYDLMHSNKLTTAMKYTILTQILEGLAFLHSHNIIHRDLKPQNILIVEHDGRYAPLITDFGISKQLNDGESSAVSNSILGGTRSYASPEQLKERSIRKNTDLWSFGIIAYQMLIGELPFNCGTFSPTSEEGRLEHFRQMTSGILPDALNGISEPWQTLIRKCLEVDNAKRVQRVDECLLVLSAGGTSSTNFDTIVEDKTPEAKQEPQKRVNAMPLNKLYRKYAIGAMVFALLFGIFEYLKIVGFELQIGCDEYYRNFMPHEYLGTFLYEAFPKLTGTYVYIDWFFRSSFPLLQWLALIGVYVSVRGFARAQISMDDASAVRKVSFGVLFAIISMTILPISSPFLTLHFFFCELLQYAGIAISIWGIAKLLKSQYQTQGARTGLRFVQIFLFLLIPIYLFSDLITVICLWSVEINKLTYIDRYVWFRSYTSWGYWLMLPINCAKTIVALLAVFGIGKVALSRNEVETEPYNALCKANDEATSTPRSLRIWLYGMSAIAIYSILNTLHWKATHTIDSHGYVIGEGGHDIFWVELYCRIFGEDYYGLGWNGWYINFQYILPQITTFALALWLLLNNNIRCNKGAMLGLIGIVLSSLIMPTLIFIGSSVECIDDIIGINIEEKFEIVGDALEFITFLLFGSNIVSLLIAVCTLLFVWCAEFKRYTKAILTITLSFTIIISLYWGMQRFAEFMDWQWLHIDFGEKFNDARTTIAKYMNIVEAVTLLISAGLITTFTKHKWIKWVTIALAAIFTLASLYSYHKINELDEQRIAEKARREKIAELNQMVLDGKGRNGVYKVGDYYNRDGLEGIVFEVSSNGKHGKIVSLDQTKTEWDSWVYHDPYGDVGAAGGGITTNATSETDGKANTDKLMDRFDSYRFNAAEWCREKGSQWYLPSIAELGTLFSNIDKIRNYKEPEDDYENGFYYPSNWEVRDARQANWDAIYWSSTETSDVCAEWFISYDTVDFGPGDDYDVKCNKYTVRAIAKF